MVTRDILRPIIVGRSGPFLASYRGPPHGVRGGRRTMCKGMKDRERDPVNGAVGPAYRGQARNG